jgi:2-hydroxy-3-keto-5-methylthiopentenyl-1-phosphate phosphatase
MTEVDAATAIAADLRRVLAVMDFDGTITSSDCMETLLRRHVAAWPTLAEAVSAGRLSQAAALAEAVAMLKIPRARILGEFAESAVLRGGFREFLDRLLGGGGRAAVVSVGFREGIAEVWRRERLAAIPVYAGELLGDLEVGFRLELDAAYGDCPVCGPGRCKGAVVRRLRREGDVVLAFGDGSRDLCMAREADLVFARARLARLCDREGIACRPLDDFSHACRELSALG